MKKLFNENKLFFLLAFAVIGARLIFSWLDMSFILGRVVDDAFYYFKTAQNIAKAHTSTFDGINKTNGYHPLWMAIILPVFYLTKGNNYLSIHLVMTLQVIILALIIFLIWKIFNKEFGASHPLVALTLFLWPRFLSQTEYGLEAGLSILLLLLSANYCLSNKILTLQSNHSKNFFFGVILAFVFLARLDSIFYLTSIAFYLLSNIYSGKPDKAHQKKAKLFFEKIILIFISPVIISMPYLLWNYLSFGHLTPISGSLKHSFPVVSFNPEYFLQFPEFSIIFIIAVGFLIITFLKNNSIKILVPNKDYRAILIVFAMYVVIHFLDTIFFMKWAVFRWHFAGYTVFLLLAIPLFIRAAKEKLQHHFLGIKQPFSFLVSFLIILVLFAQFVSVKRSLANKFQYQGYREALWIKENTSPDDTFMLEDAGIISYFSNRRIVNIDGVINNFEFQNYLKDGRFLEYIRDKNIKYFVHHAFWNNPEVRNGNYDKYLFKSYSHLYEVFGGTLTLKKSDEIYRSKEYNHFGRKTIFIIWKINNTID